MSRPASTTALRLNKLLLRPTRNLASSLRSPPSDRASSAARLRAITASHSLPVTTRRPFSTTRQLTKGLSPESAEPAPKEAETAAYESPSAPAEISVEEYHELADAYLDTLMEKLEALQEEREEVDVEYSVCHPLPSCPPPEVGTCPPRDANWG